MSDTTQSPIPESSSWCDAMPELEAKITSLEAANRMLREERDALRERDVMLCKHCGHEFLSHDDEWGNCN
jgi:hypothetical protein